MTDHTSGFTVEDVTAGRYAHGFGRTGDGRSFAFRTFRSTLVLEIYRADLETDVPDTDDIDAVAQTTVTDIDLDDERSIVALVRDLIPQAVPVTAAQPREPTPVRALLGRLSAVIDGM
ncbi:hypothetical protein [Nocardia uniformis]|uniref:hypothetical protein n=1 Tax=Nocardia uniformis TaxID=53432 RepID=UPI000AA6E519|nr:hypothetical protein [Nocardia uniformis]